jgi:Arc/MetJ-type ribon-helix-helix transcriptional regulator
MAEDLTIKIPNKLAEFLDELVEEEYFTSRKDFGRCAIELIAEMYGFSGTSRKGKSFLEILTENSAQLTVPQTASQQGGQQAAVGGELNIKAKALSPIELDVLDLFFGSTFEYEDALHAKYTMELMKVGKGPMPKDQFLSVLEGLASKEKIEKGEHAGKVIWKVLSRE